MYRDRPINTQYELKDQGEKKEKEKRKTPKSPAVVVCWKGKPITQIVCIRARINKNRGEKR